MSNESTSRDGEHAFCNRFSSSTPGSSSGGATTIPSVSGTPCSTSISSATETSFGGPPPSPAKSLGVTRKPLAELVINRDYDARVNHVAERIGRAASQVEVLTLFRLAVKELGVDCAMFANFVRDASDVSSCRFMLACEPRWCQHYIDAEYLKCDPWLEYAADHSEPIVASRLPVIDPAQQQVVEWAHECGFASTALVPVHSGVTHPRASLLCLGVSAPGFFEDDAFGRFRLGARLVAAELHDWWRSCIRREAILKARLTPTELSLLRHEHQGHSSKQIAAELKVSKSSINSRFQRMNTKLGVPNRRMAARLAVECGLLIGSGTR